LVHSYDHEPSAARVVEAVSWARLAVGRLRCQPAVFDPFFFLVHYVTMKRINVHEAKTHLSRYLERVERGQAFLVCRRNEPIAELRPVKRERATARPLGLAKGRLRVPPSFFKSLPEDLLAAFEGKRS
jgi:prevent-host-death family protein